MCNIEGAPLGPLDRGCFNLSLPHLEEMSFLLQGCLRNRAANLLLATLDPDDLDACGRHQNRPLGHRCSGARPQGTCRSRADSSWSGAAVLPRRSRERSEKSSCYVAPIFDDEPLQHPLRRPFSAASVSTSLTPISRL